MSGTENLIEEHRLIASVLDAFDVFVDAVERESAYDHHDLVRFVTFFREYADLVHHEKEEGLILPALASAGFDWDTGLLAEVRRDHNQERYLIRSLRHAAMQKERWSREDQRHFASIARTFTEFVRKHVEKEEAILFPALRERVSPEARSELARRVAQFDARWSEHGELDWLRTLASELSAAHPSPARPGG